MKIIPHFTHSIAVIGGGNMALNLVGGLCAADYPGNLITVTGPHELKLEPFYRFDVHTTQNNLEAAKNADIIILAVKPKIVKEVCQELASIVNERKPLMISIASGITLEQLAGWLGENQAIIRAMPNTPSKVLQGVTGLCANIHVTENQRSLAEELFKTVGIISWFDDEQLLHAVTALSGSGPAYYFLLMEAIAYAGAELGLSPEIAKLFSIQTALGAAKLAADSILSLEELRAQVTSPQGTTSKAIEVMEDNNIRDIMHKALTAAYKRSIELTDEGKS